MQLIIGLGNPGSQYTGSRHNAGWWAVERLQQAWNFPNFATQEKFQADISVGMRDGQKILLAKPLTFMNRSGESIRHMLDFYKLTPADLLVIQDELDLPLGRLKLATDSSSAGHNGIQNVIDHVGTQSFKRLRIGIGLVDETCALPTAHDFVLERFRPEEAERLDALWPEVLFAIEKALPS